MEGICSSQDYSIAKPWLLSYTEIIVQEVRDLDYIVH